ncbi:ImmA/IrrE family metallo-endopeptidase [Clostridium culturomicium]|uniref:ImmA/IrrE family metallo-endopeptidase n=1 Tax=Clostridium culturomicium TaxID=1499683 RepID=UPI00058D7B24|nr:ImmA/IrrE family metallo-endopeptidase [Clostridium culturomicium]
MKNYIKKEVNRLIKKYNTNNPFEIAKGENIIILFEKLGNINGYYNKYARQKFIHINEDLDFQSQFLTCAHELGHARIHPDSNTPFFRDNSFYSINKLEKQANYFSAELLIDANKIDKCLLGLYSVEQLAAIYNVPVELINLKFNLG